jgi:L-glyceraldehyde 3-phosphate reductase
MFDRWIEDKLLGVLEEEKIGCIAFSPLAQGILTNKYLTGIPEESRAAKPGEYLREEDITKNEIAKVAELNKIAAHRGQSMAQMAIAWVLRHQGMTSALIGASKVSQIEDIIKSLDNPEFANVELVAIEKILNR